MVVVVLLRVRLLLLLLFVTVVIVLVVKLSTASASSAAAPGAIMTAIERRGRRCRRVHRWAWITMLRRIWRRKQFISSMCRFRWHARRRITHVATWRRWRQIGCGVMIVAIARLRCRRTISLVDRRRTSQLRVRRLRLILSLHVLGRRRVLELVVWRTWQAMILTTTIETTTVSASLMTVMLGLRRRRRRRSAVDPAFLISHGDALSDS
jgi:hypothetical protein